MKSRILNILLFPVLLLAPNFAHAQAVRWDLGAPGSAGAVMTSGNQLFAAANVALNWCNYPANAVPCTNYANTYSSISLATLCPVNAQVVLQGSSTCQGSSDNFGNIGVWTAPNTACNGLTCYAYTLTVNGVSSGPYIWISGAGGGSGTVAGTNNQITVTPSGGISTVSLPSQVILPGSISGPTTATFGTNGGSGQQALFLTPDVNGICMYYGGPSGIPDQISDAFGALYWLPLGSGFPCQQILTVQPLPSGITPALGQGYFWSPSQNAFVLGYAAQPNYQLPGALCFYPSNGGNPQCAPDSLLTEQNGILNYQGAGGIAVTGNGFGFGQAVVGLPQPYGVRINANIVEPSTGLNIVLPAAGAAGTWGATYGNGAAATITCSSCGSLTTGTSGANITVSAGGTYAYPPACRIVGGGGTGATCSVLYLSGGAVTAAAIQFPNGGANYASTATIQFIPQLEMTLAGALSGISETISDSGVFGSNEIHAPAACETSFGITTLSGASTNTGLNCLPAGAVIDAVVYRITTTITTATSFTIGDSGSATRYCGTQSTLTAGTTGTCVAAGYYFNSGALPIKITPSTAPGAGALRLIVYYHTWTAPTS